MQNTITSDRIHHLAAGSRRPRLEDRFLDVATLLALPDEPVPWRCDRLAADGFVTLLTGEGGEGKSLLTLALAKGVAEGATVAGISCKAGKVLMFDAENGERLMARRMKAVGMPLIGVRPCDADGYDLQLDAEQFDRVIRAERANLVIIDSLRILAPRARESEADHMAPLMTTIRQLARNTNTAIIVVHHRPKGDGASDYRGSSVIRDQTDMLFVLGRHPNDSENATRRFLRTSKCRIDEEPATRWLTLHLDPVTGRFSIEEAEPFQGGGTSGRTTVHEVADQLRPQLTSEPQSRAELARSVDRPENDGTVGRALAALQAEGYARQTPQGWVRASQPSEPQGDGWLADSAMKPPEAS